MFTVRYGGKGGPTVRFVESPNHLVVRTEHREALERAPVSLEARQVLGEFRTAAPR